MGRRRHNLLLSLDNTGERMDGKAPIFEKTYQDYLARVKKLDLQDVAQKTAAQWDGKRVTVPLFGIPYRISGDGITDPSGNEPVYSIKVVLCQYLLLHPPNHSEDGAWVSYKDFKDAAPLANSFHVKSEIGIAGNFEGRLNALKEACSGIGGYDHSEELNYDLVIKFDALPRVPILLLFNDVDDEFPSQCLLLFEKRAKHYLDMECLAILGWLLAEKLGSFEDGKVRR
jgi:hypothetical protein